MHEKLMVRKLWATHGVDGWYLGPAMKHYRCHTVYITKTRGGRIADTVEFFPKDLPMPKTSSVDMAIKAASELTHALQHPVPLSPFHKFGDSTLAALEKLATIFRRPWLPNLRG